MSCSTPPVNEAYNQARRFLTIGIQEAVSLATEAGLEMTTIKAAALDVGAFLLKFGTPPKPAPPRPKFRVVRPPSTQLRLPLE